MRSPLSYKSKENCITQRKIEISNYLIVSRKLESKSKVLDDVPLAGVEWTQREINWYLAEDRFLFGANDELEVHKWLLVFQWILSNSRLK